MIYLYQKGLPNTIVVNGRSIFIKTDFRVWLDFYIKNENNTIETLPDLSFILEKKEPITQEIYDELIKFSRQGSIYPIQKRTLTGAVAAVESIDFVEDGPFIYAAFMKHYKINLTKDDLHWYEFRALLNGLSAEYSDIIYARNYTGDNKELIQSRQQWTINKNKKEVDDLVKQWTEKLKAQAQEYKKKIGG